VAADGPTYIPPGESVRPSFAIARPALPSPAPPAPPSVSPSFVAPDEPQKQQKQYRTDRCVDDRTDNSGAEMDADLRQQPASYEGAYYPDNKVTNEAETGPSHDLPSQPAIRPTSKITKRLSPDIFIVRPRCSYSSARVAADWLRFGR
jgi:hypothetical protein